MNQVLSCVHVFHKYHVLWSVISKIFKTYYTYQYPHCWFVTLFPFVHSEVPMQKSPCHCLSSNPWLLRSDPASIAEFSGQTGWAQHGWAGSTVEVDDTSSPRTGPKAVSIINHNMENMTICKSIIINLPCTSCNIVYPGDVRSEGSSKKALWK